MLLGTESLQTFGGSGFLQDYPVEQYVRDAKIDTLYEGTTAIQGLDFFFRKIVKDQGVAISHVAMQIQEFAKDLGAAGGAFDKERELLGQAQADVQGILEYVGTEAFKSDPRMGGEIRNIYKVGLNTSRLLLAAGDLVVGWLLLREAEVAQEALTSRGDTLSAKDRDFYTGKVAAGGSTPANVLPRLAAERADRRGHRRLDHGPARVGLLTGPPRRGSTRRRSRQTSRRSSRDLADLAHVVLDVALFDVAALDHRGVRGVGPLPVLDGADDEGQQAADHEDVADDVEVGLQQRVVQRGEAEDPTDDDEKDS